MKKQFLTKFALATLALTMFGYNANAQLGNLKNKVKNAAGSVGNKDEKKDEKKDEQKNDTSTNSSSTNSNATTSNTGSKAAGDLKWYKVDKNTTVFSSDYGFGSPKTDFKTGENIFVRFAFPKSIADVFNEKFPDHQKSTASYNIAIAKNIDDENPIIISEGTFSIYNYEKINMMDFSISADEKTIDGFVSHKGDVDSKLCGMSVATLAKNSISVQWQTQAPLMKGGKKDWEIFLIFSPGDKILDERAPVMVAQGKFSYTYDAKASSSQYAGSIKPLKAVPDDGITSDFHKSHLNQIVFSKNQIPKTGASDAALTTTFNLGDDIYLRSFIEKSVVNEMAAVGAEAYHTSDGRSIILRVYADGKLFTDMPGTDKLYKNEGEFYHFCPIGEDFNLNNSTTFHSSFSRTWGSAGDKGKDYDNFLLEFFHNTWQLAPGSHKIKLELVFNIPADGATSDQKYTSAFGEEKLLATGEFTLNVTDAGKVTTGKKLCSMPDIKTELGYYGMPALTKMPKAPEWIKKHITENGMKATLLKVVEGAEWAYIKNSYGIIIKRELWGTAFLQDNDTKLYYARRIKFTEQNISSGGAKYGQTVWEWNDFDNVGKRFCKECLGK